MKSKTNFWTRSLAALLSLAMLLAMMPAIGILPKAEAYTHEITDNGTQGDGYISLPITIRDFPADGMFFESNEYGNTGSFSVSEGTSTETETTKYTVHVNTGIFASGETAYVHVKTTASNATYWHKIFVNSDGSVYKVVANGDNTSVSIPSGGFEVMVNTGCSSYSFFAGITESTKSNYTLSYSGTTLTVKRKLPANTITYNYGNTAGFGLLQSGSATHDNMLDGSLTAKGVIQNGVSISGTQLIQNGLYNTIRNDL